MYNIFKDSVFFQDEPQEQKNKESVSILYRRYTVARIYVILSMITTIIISIFEPESLYYSQFMGQGTHGIVVLCIFSFFTALSLIDMVVNDFMPNKYRLMLLYNNRHLVFMLLALCAYGLTAAVILTDHTSIVLIRVWLDGFIAAVVAVLDIFARHGKGVEWESGK